MSLDGYKAVVVNLFHAASDYTAVVTISKSSVGNVKLNDTFEAGAYDVAANHYGLVSGKAEYELFINEHLVGSCKGDLDDSLCKAGSSYLDGHSATRKTVKGIKVRKSDVLKVVGKPVSSESALLDYVSFLPEGMVD